MAQPHVAVAATPRHIAVIMDGNGRWAKQRGLPRTAGHEQGEHSLFDVVEGAIEIGVGAVSKQRVGGHARAQPPLLVVEDRDADARGAEVDAGDEGHARPVSPQRLHAIPIAVNIAVLAASACRAASMSGA